MERAEGPTARPSTAASGVVIDLKIAKTKRYTEGFGTIEGARLGDKVRARLFRRSGDRFELYSKRSRSIERMRDGRGVYVLPTERPRTGRCRLKLLHGRAGMWTKAVATFDCYMPSFDRAPGRLSGAGTTKDITVLLADDVERRSYGLMFRRKLPAERGMAFIFPETRSGGFWMKNVHIPLSIAFYDSGGTILRILDMEPCGADPCPVYDPGVPYDGALEVNQGAFARWGISEGDRFSPTP